ncbi:guanylate cyclase 2G-like protein [Labeo rohita]|uniref:Guanylate cyclase 2G-like protein n=1 Tax=Labeo rohita TaxID=84645 RepID=A0A498N2P3_LABRO|nr:guanylate cyclase 2G-like protein [Labeo rohita]
MALLWVNQAKTLKDLHKGGHNSEVLRELCTVSDLTLRATKVTAWSLGCVMSTLVVQECHLWLCLADMRETDKMQFLNSHVSQTGLFGDALENFAQQFSAAQKQTEAVTSCMQLLPPPGRRWQYLCLLVTDGGPLHPPPFPCRIRNSP